MMLMSRFFSFTPLFGAALLIVSCSLGEDRQVLVSSSPAGAETYLNGKYAGLTPVVQEVANRKPLQIYIDKPGYYPIDQVIMPHESFWGTVLWWGVDDKALSLPEENFVYTLEKMPPGAVKPARKPLLRSAEPKESPFSLRSSMRR